MAEEIMTNEQSYEQDYIDKLTELKANSVARSEYDRLRADNKKLLDAVFNGAQVEEEQPAKETVSDQEIQSLRNELYGGRFDGTDLDYMTKTLKLRKALMDRGEPDPAVSRGEHTIPTEEDYERCEAVCNVLQEAVDYAKGDPAVFRSELTRLTSRKK